MLSGAEAHPHARAVLEPALAPGGSPSHAYLFHGPAGSGKRAVARAFAGELLSAGAPDPAGARARVQSGAHPDLTWVAPSGAADMLVSDIDEPVVMAATRTPFESARRVFVIERVDTMNDQAANRMLKTLEEPAAFAHLVLLTDRPGEVLATIASRCQAVRFDARPAADVAASLERRGIAAATALACARVSLGDATRAEDLAFGTGPAVRASAEAFARACLVDSLASRPWNALLAEARRAGEAAAAECESSVAETLEFVSKKDRKRVEREGAERGKRAQRRAATASLDLGLTLVGLWFRDLAVVAIGAEELVLNADRVAELRADVTGLDVGAVRSAVAVVDDTRERLVLNVSEELALEALAYRLARSFGAT